MRTFIFNQTDDFQVAAALGLVEGIDPIRNAGFSSILTLGVETDVSLLGVTEIPLPDNAGQTIQVWSTDAGDTTQQIQIDGLGPDGVAIESQIATLNGITPVDLPLPMSRINEALNVSNNPVVGTVNIGVSPATIFCNILPAFQISKQSIYSIPADYNLILPNITASFRRVGTGTDVFVLVRGKTKRFEQTFFYGDIEFEISRDGSNFAALKDEFPLGIVGPSDIKISANSTGTNARILARINGLLTKVN